MTTLSVDQAPKLKRIFIQSQMPEALAPLREIAFNLWWCWHHDAIELFKSLDEEAWFDYPNPLAILEGLTPARMQALAQDKAFVKKIKQVEKAFNAYMKVKPDTEQAQIAYFSMEYGLHTSVRLYSGGLGVLAGDYLKEASDRNTPLAAVGLLYRYGYFEQGLSPNGEQINDFVPQHFTKMPLEPVRRDDDSWVKVTVDLPGRRVVAKVWKLMVGRVPLYLLDTDLDENTPEDRELTHKLYGGGNEHRLKQEILLGIGGVRALKAIGLEADIYHLNEGHAAFSNLERLRNYVQHEGYDFPTALELVRSGSLFTTHTPVPAGHDYFAEPLLRQYLYGYVVGMGLAWEQFIGMGRIDAQNPEELFSMSHLAIRSAQEVNGVSALHGEVSRAMFASLYPGYQASELHIGHVTNGVHYPTWIAKEWHQLFQEMGGKDFAEKTLDFERWAKIDGIDNDRIMAIRQLLKQRLIEYVKVKLQKDLTARGESPRQIFGTINQLRDDALIIGFARRFATYKRAHLLFTDLDRLNRIVNNPDRPVLFIFSGKAHPADQGGQALIRQINEIAHRPEFLGKIIFLENYNMEVGRVLTQGVDVWLNTPTRPKEASGTSGMKAAFNGVPNFSVLDGWWDEGYLPGAGWALPKKRTYTDQQLQNQLDAELIYATIEEEIVPAFYGTEGEWVAIIKKLIAEVAPHFSMTRMLRDYQDRFYSKLAVSQKAMHADNGKTAHEVTRWKAQIKALWPSLEVLHMDVWDTDNRPLPVGASFSATLQLRLAGIPANAIGVELLFFRRHTNGQLELILNKPLKLVAETAQTGTYSCSFQPDLSGVYEYGFRAIPQHPALVNRQDFPLVTWL